MYIGQPYYKQSLLNISYVCLLSVPFSCFDAQVDSLAWSMGINLQNQTLTVKEAPFVSA